jgi:hypothetical protein
LLVQKWITIASVELNPEDIVADPGLRKLTEELDVNIRDAAMREYFVMGPCQPVGHKFPSNLLAKQTEISGEIV